MEEQRLYSKNSHGISDEEIYGALKNSVKDFSLKDKNVLLIPPDFTRMHSGGGKITSMYYSILKDCKRVDILPALGTHDPMTREECSAFFGSNIPFEKIINHDWRNDVVKIGNIPESFVREISGQLVDYSINVEINKRLSNGSYDLIISIGQVVPHEVAGMANYNKNIFVGCGGKDMINKSHMLGAVYGMEKVMGKDRTPVHRIFDYAQESFLNKINIMYVLTVTTAKKDNVNIEGLFTGKSRRVFENAIELSTKKNFTTVGSPLKKTIVYLDPKEFKSTWLGNKAVYRTRMAISDGGELIILAPGIKKFGEDKIIDSLIRKYGYAGRKKILSLFNENEDLKNNLSAAAHLIHGSSDGRFEITYVTEHLSKDEIESVGYSYLSPETAYKKYNPAKLKEGFNVLDNKEEVYYISNPALGLWKA